MTYNVLVILNAVKDLINLKMHNDHNYFVYITTNIKKNVIYIGITNDLYIRLIQNKKNNKYNKTFAGKYNCYYLIYWERHTFVEDAIDREKEIKGWTRQKKIIS